MLRTVSSVTVALGLLGATVAVTGAAVAAAPPVPAATLAAHVPTTPPPSTSTFPRSTPGTPPSSTPRPPWGRSRNFAPCWVASLPAISLMGVSSGSEGRPRAPGASSVS